MGFNSGFKGLTGRLRPAFRTATRLARPLRPAVASVESHDVTAGSELFN